MDKDVRTVLFAMVGSIVLVIIMYVVVDKFDLGLYLLIPGFIPLFLGIFALYLIIMKKPLTKE